MTDSDEEIQETMFLFNSSSSSSSNQINNETDKETDKETDSDKDLEHHKKPIAKKIKLKRITNWNLKIISGISELKKVFINRLKLSKLRNEPERKIKRLGLVPVPF